MLVLHSLGKTSTQQQRLVLYVRGSQCGASRCDQTPSHLSPSQRGYWSRRMGAEVQCHLEGIWRASVAALQLLWSNH